MISSKELPSHYSSNSFLLADCLAPAVGHLDFWGPWKQVMLEGFGD